jgi:hypothetical protein
MIKLLLSSLLVAVLAVTGHGQGCTGGYPGGYGYGSYPLHLEGGYPGPAAQYGAPAGFNLGLQFQAQRRLPYGYGGVSDFRSANPAFGAPLLYGNSPWDSRFYRPTGSPYGLGFS